MAGLKVDRVTKANTRIFDFGINSTGGLNAGLILARVCMADLVLIRIVPGQPEIWPGPAIAVQTDHPVASCMASQYAGWQITGDNYYAMGSGPMRAAAGREELFDKIQLRENADVAVGVLEARTVPPTAVCEELAAQCHVAPEQLTLLIAPTASQAGNIQIVARSIETAMHKLLELGFDINRIVSGYGVAPLPPVAADDLGGIGRTNDAILYGASVTLWSHGDDQSLSEVIDRVPSIASRDHGQPFQKIFERYDGNFYEIDPHLFSPAQITIVNIDSGRIFRAGKHCPELLQKSFEG